MTPSRHRHARAKFEGWLKFKKSSSEARTEEEWSR
jgi:hypothetical protein